MASAFYGISIAIRNTHMTCMLPALSVGCVPTLFKGYSGHGITIPAPEHHSNYFFDSKCRRAKGLGIQPGQLLENLHRHGGASLGRPLATNRWLQDLTPWRRWGERSRAKQHSITDENNSKEKAEIHAKFDESGWR